MPDINSEDKPVTVEFGSGLRRLQELGLDPAAIEAGEDIASREGDGGSFAVRPPAPPETEADDKEGEDDTEYSDAMSVIDQMERYPNTCQAQPPETRVYDLSKQHELEAWNMLQAKAIQPGTRAGNLLLRSTINFYAGVYYVHVSIQPIRFERLV